MKNKQPWTPPKPKHARKCPECHGLGVAQYFIDTFHGTRTMTCHQCGGKGFK